MLEFFRKYQRYFFFVITVVVIASFSFFGTYSAFGGETERKDKVIGQAIDGSNVMLSEVQKLSRFIATDREDSIYGRGLPPNFCNDGVVRYDFIKAKLAHLLVNDYFDALKGDFAARLEKVKRFRPYVHPEAEFLSARTVWQHLLPSLNSELAVLQAEKEVSLAVFAHLAQLYQFQGQLQPETLRRILIYQHQQYPWLTIDQRLSYDDLALFGFHSIGDWFGRDFVDLVAQFILNAAKAAEERGYRVSLEEAKGDLIHHFQESLQKLAEAKMKSDFNFQQHLRSLGFDERSASESWRKVLLFRRYFHDVGETAFIDSLPYRDFAEYAKEVAVVQQYEWPIKVNSAQDLAELQFYIKAVSNKTGGLPTTFLSVDEVEKKTPQLVQTTYKAKVGEVSKKQLSLRSSMKEVWEWELTHWDQIRKKFSLADAEGRDERFQVLERLEPKLRAQVDGFAREAIVDQNQGWVDEALAAAPLNEKIWTTSGNEEPNLKEEGVYYRIENLEKVEDKHILAFAKARAVLAKLVGKVEGDYAKEKNPFASASKEALAALQKNPTDSKWIQSGKEPLADQFKLERNTQEIQRNSQENWMKEQAFLMLPDLWSPIHLADDGKILFFYLQEKKTTPAPILDQLAFGKETLAADAQAYVTERLLQVVKKKKAIVIPVQKEDEE